MDPLATALLAALTGTWSLLTAAFFRGDMIPGHVYRREVKRADTATTQAERNAQAIQALARALQERPNAPTG